MRLINQFLSKIIGHKLIKFYEDEILLFNFPMFFLPIDIYKNFIEEVIKEYPMTGKNVLNQVGYIQGYFAADFFNKKFNIKPNFKDFNFYLEQSQSIGLGSLKLVTYTEEFKNMKFISNHSVKFSKDYYDYYLEGLVKGTIKILFSKNYDCMIKKTKSNQAYIIANEKKENTQIDEDLRKNYILKNISVNSKCKKEQNIYFNKIKKKHSKSYYSNKNGTFLNEQKYFFTLKSVLASTYYLFLKENEKIRKIFYYKGREFAKHIFEYYSDYINQQKKHEFYSLLPLFGINNIKIVSFNSNKAIFNIEEASFEKISKNLFYDKYNIINNEFKFGIIEELYLLITGNKNFIAKIKKHNNKKIIFIIKSF